MTNETENCTNDKTRADTQQVQINTILNVAATLDDETVVKSICEILEIDYEEIKDKLPKQEEGTEGAQGILDSIQIEEGVVDE